MSLFDGDGLNDTLPDPGVPEGFNSGVTKVTLDGKVVPLPTGITAVLHELGRSRMDVGRGKASGCGALASVPVEPMRWGVRARSMSNPGSRPNPCRSRRAKAFQRVCKLMGTMPGRLLERR